MKKLIIVILILLIVGSASGIAYIQHGRSSTKNAIAQIKEEPATSESGESAEFPFEEIKRKNSDFSGWLTIDGTKIDLPIMKNKENPLFYLDHNFAGEADKNGLPFLDERNATDFSDEVTIIYGHNMQSGLIFHELELYKDLSYFKKHDRITIDTENGTKEYQVLAYIEKKIASTDSFSYNYYTSFDTQEEHEDFLAGLLENSVHPVELPESSQTAVPLLILSTCDNLTTDGRIALIAYEII